MKLQNIQKVGSYRYRVVLANDVFTPDCNYVERTKGAYYDEQLCEHRCLKCTNVVYWLYWTKDGDRAKATCGCGQEQTLEYLVCFDQVAKTF